MFSGIEVPDNVVSDTIGADTIVINISSGAYYSLTPAGAEVWSKVIDESIQPVGNLDGALQALANEGLITSSRDGDGEGVDPTSLFDKYSDMADLLIADPIHEVGPDGWPHLL